MVGVLVFCGGSASELGRAWETKDQDQNQAHALR